MHTILGAGVPVATELARQLPALTAEPLRLVSRHPQPVNPGDEVLAADLTDAAQVLRAVAGSTVVYLTAGLPYDTATWQRDWPRIMRNVLDACEQHGARLVFFDNVYAYGVSLSLAVLPEAPMPELVERMYQYELPYVFDSQKLEQQFFVATPYAEGIRRAAGK